MSENALRSRRSTDIAHANEKNLNFSHIFNKLQNIYSNNTIKNRQKHLNKINSLCDYFGEEIGLKHALYGMPRTSENLARFKPVKKTLQVNKH
jgi:hypothetical protein